MKHMNRSMRRVLLASTALVVAGFLSSATAQSTVDTTTGVISVAAALDGFVSATSQRATGTNAEAGIAASQSTIDQTDTTAITTPQTIFGDSATAEARLNQGTNTLTIEAPEDPGTFAGTTSINSSGLMSIAAASGILSLQDLTGDAGLGDVTAIVGTAANTPLEFQILLQSPSVAGTVTNSGNEAVADALANDAVNSLTVTGPGNGSLDSPAAIANLQRITPSGGSTDVTADAFGDVKVTITGPAISGEIELDQNTVGSRAAANMAENNLIAGSADSTAQGSLAGTLTSTFVETNGAIGGFVADFGVANLQQVVAGQAPGDRLSVESNTSGVVALDVDPTAAITSPQISARGNSILSEAAGNTAANRGIATTSGLNGVSVGVASLQEFNGESAVTDVLATAAGTVSVGGDATNPSVAGGALTSAVNLSDNRIAAQASGNDAVNVAAVTSTGSLGGSQSYVAGRQVANQLGVSARTTAGDVVVNVVEAAGNSTLVLNNNAISADASLNRQTNVLQNTGASNLRGGATMVSTSQQEVTGGSSSAVVTAAELALRGTTESIATATLARNTVLASATANVSTTSITNRSGGFSFNR